jgi:hypothetical protein
MGRVDVTRRFGSVCRQCARELHQEYERTQRDLAKDLAQVTDKYIIPILGDYMCHNVTRDVVWCKYSNEPYDIVIKQYYG